MKVYASEGPHEAYVFGSLAHAEDYFEAVDVENDEYVFFSADGTSISASVRDGRVVLTPTTEQHLVELRARLGAYLQHPRVAMKAELADDPLTLAELPQKRERKPRRWTR